MNIERIYPKILIWMVFKLKMPNENINSLQEKVSCIQAIAVTNIPGII